jgi:hypothetical protein
MATGRDAADVAITTTFGMAELKRFSVVTKEVANCEPLENGQSYSVGSEG